MPDTTRSLYRRIDEFVESERGELIQLCANLVESRSVNPPGETVEAAQVVQRYFDKSGIGYELLSNVIEKTNLVSQVFGEGHGRHLVFNGHLDTIGAGDENQWTVPIFELTQQSGRLYGIGMGNMKGAVAAMAIAHVFLARNTSLWSGQISFTAVADETIFGSDGAEYLLRVRPDLVGDAVICGEGPGQMNLAIAEKGLLWIRIEATAEVGQGMLSTKEISATSRLAALIVELDRLNEKYAQKPEELATLEANDINHGLRLSVNTGTLQGGEFVSQLATKASAEVDFRIPPGLTTKDICLILDSIIKPYQGVTYSVIKGWDPNWTPSESPICSAVYDAASYVRDQEPAIVVRLPASDASRWRKLGVPGICYGPQPELASGLDDYANEQDVIDCAKVYALAAIGYLS